MDRSKVTRRIFLGAVAAIPATAALSSCAEEAAPLDASMRGDAHTPPDASTAVDAHSLDDAAMGIDAPDAAPEPHCEPGLARIDLRRDCGAVGDGVTDDTDALARAAAMIQSAGGGELTIPPGTYLVGRQSEHPGEPGPFYRPAEMFSVTGLTCLKISGFGAVLKTTPGLHFGAFDPRTGAPSTERTTAPTSAAHIGRMLEIVECSSVLIEGLELDGSNETLVLGGGWGDRERQTAATGLWLNRCADARIVDVRSHHHGLDGIAVLHLASVASVRKPHTLERVVSEYNSRQGLSWIGGWGLECIDCEFNHTGKAINRGGGMDDGEPFFSAPGAGVDIEPNPGRAEASRDGVFTRCEFVDNAGPGLHADVGDGGYSTFTDCTFWGTTFYSLWADRPGLRFRDCRMHGTVVHAHDGRATTDGPPDAALATLYEDCTFEDLEWTDGRVFRGARSAYLYDSGAGAQGATWRDCTFRTHRARAVYIGGEGTEEHFERCRFVFGHTELPDLAFQASFAGSRITSCHFSETADISAGTRDYYIQVRLVTVGVPAAGDDPTHVVGPRVRWGAPRTGRIGDIPPGRY